MYLIDILRIEFDVRREGRAAQTYQSAGSDRLDEFRQIVCFGNRDSLVNFLFLVCFDDYKCVCAAHSRALLLQTRYGTGNTCVDRCADKSIGIANKLSYFYIVAFLY